MMGLARLLTRKPAAEQHDRLAGSGFQVIIDNHPVNFPTSIYQGGMSIPGAWRASLLLSDLLGQVPWDAFRTRGGEPVEKIQPTPLLLEQPYPPDTRMTTFSSMGLDLIWHGNAIGVIAARAFDGTPTAFIPIPAEQVGVRYVNNKSTTPLNAGPVEYSVGNNVFRPDQVIHIKGPCKPGALRGFGVIEAHLDGTIKLAQDQAGQAGSLSSHGVPTGLLKSQNPDLTSDEAAQLKAKWLESQANRTIAVLNATTDFEPLAWNPSELQLLEARKFTLHELSLIFGLPPSFLGVETSNRTYRNDETEDIKLIKYSLGGHLARFEQTFSNLYPRGTRVKANLDSILRGDTLTRYQAHSVGLTNGFLTVDEVREIEDRPPLPDSPDTPVIVNQEQESTQ